MSNYIFSYLVFNHEYFRHKWKFSIFTGHDLTSKLPDKLSLFDESLLAILYGGDLIFSKDVQTATIQLLDELYLRLEQKNALEE
ncbi:MAG: hypothetical protein HN834_19780 [Rhodospirillaceae bacterium]|jgi:hypothetical protein|nr:hypothetical protein [Rhodospirillaceae bacterium]